MNNEKLLIQLELAWQDFTASYAGLPPERMLEPGVTGDWSVKDILAHVTWWEEEALKHLPQILQGVRPTRYSVTYGGIDAFNAQMTGLKRDLPLDDVLRQLDETHQRLVAYLHSLPADAFTAQPVITRFRHRLRLDTYSHYPIHAQAIRAWRERLSILP